MLQYEYFEKDARRIDEFDAKIENAKIIFDGINKEEEEFTNSVQPPEKIKLLKWYGVLCSIALLLDFFVNTNTMEFMPRLFSNFDIPVTIFAIIFTFLDAMIASLQAGSFAKTPLEKAAAKRIWRPILWSLAGVKLVLFVIFILIKEINISGLGVDLVFTFLQVFLLIIVYLILDFAGEGIYYVTSKSKFIFLRNIWYVSPFKLIDNKINLLKKLKRNCKNMGIDPNDIINHFNISKKYTEE